MAVGNELPSLEDEPGTASATGTTQLLERAVLLLLFAGLVIGVLAVLRPFATAVLFGTILAIAAWPLREFLLRCGLKRGLDATLLLLLAPRGETMPTVLPQPTGNHPTAQGLARHRTAVMFCQLLRRQGRAKVGIPFPHNRERQGANLSG